MINVLNRRCDLKCFKQPYFGHVGRAPTRCSKHREENMVDVYSPRCSFSYIDGTTCQNHRQAPGPFCTRHRPGYVQVVTGASKKACRFLDTYMEKHPETAVQHVHYDALTKKTTGKEHAVTLPDGCRTQVAISPRLVRSWSSTATTGMTTRANSHLMMFSPLPNGRTERCTEIRCTA